MLQIPWKNGDISRGLLVVSPFSQAPSTLTFFHGWYNWYGKITEEEVKLPKTEVSTILCRTSSDV